MHHSVDLSDLKAELKNLGHISYADMARQNNSNSHTQAEAPSSDIKGMMEMLQQILQHVMTIFSLLVKLMPKFTPVVATP